MRDRATILRLGLICVLLAFFLLASVSSANAPPNYTLQWWTVDDGGNTGGGDGYILRGTTGQPDAAVWVGDGYTLAGGFWSGARVVEYGIYLPVVMCQQQ